MTQPNRYLSYSFLRKSRKHGPGQRMGVGGNCPGIQYTTIKSPQVKTMQINWDHKADFDMVYRLRVCVCFIYGLNNVRGPSVFHCIGFNVGLIKRWLKRELFSLCLILPLPIANIFISFFFNMLTNSLPYTKLLVKVLHLALWTRKVTFDGFGRRLFTCIYT